jgi:hypothetical protein
MNATENHIPNSVGSFPKQGGPNVQWNYPGTQRSYGVQLNWKSPGIEKSMYYNVGMTCSGMKGEDGIWEIIKEDIYIDNCKSEDQLDMLAIACAEPCYPFLFSAGKTGRMTALLNIETIKQRFNKALPILQRNFAGEVSSAYINAMIDAISQPGQLKKIISSDAFLSIFFSEITGQYNQQKTKPITINYPFFGFEDPLVFNGTVAIGKPNTEYKTQPLIVNADLAAFEAASTNEILKGTLEITYDIDIPGHMIKNISANIGVDTPSGKHRLWVNAYKLNSEILSSAPKTEDKPNSKSWFSFF